MIRAYLAASAFVDWNVSRVLAALDELGLREKTHDRPSFSAMRTLSHHGEMDTARTCGIAATMRSLLTVSSDGHYVTDFAAAPITYKDSVKLYASGDGFTVHATLKPNLKWSDGSPLTSDDVRYTWEVCHSTGSPCAKGQGLTDIASVDTPDELGYWVGFNPCSMVVRAGEIVRERAV